MLFLQQVNIKPNGVLYIHAKTPGRTDQLADLFDPLTFNNAKSLMSFSPSPHPFSPESLFNVPPEV